MSRMESQSLTTLISSANLSIRDNVKVKSGGISHEPRSLIAAETHFTIGDFGITARRNSEILIGP